MQFLDHETWVYWVIKAGPILLFIILKKVNPMERAVRWRWGERGKGEGIWVLEFYSKGGLARENCVRL